MGLQRNKLINGSVFEIPYFDFGKYVSLLENPISIVSNDCWGGILTSKLGLQMNSPFCYCFIGKEDYYQILCNMEGYLQNGLYLYREGDIRNCQFPIGLLTDGKREALMNFNHHCTFDEAKADWNRRLERMNYRNMFVKVEVTENDRDYIQKFSRLQYKKVIFAPTDYGDKTCVSIPRYLWRCYNCTASGTTTFSAFFAPDELLSGSSRCFGNASG